MTGIDEAFHGLDAARRAGWARAYAAEEKVQGLREFAEDLYRWAYKASLILQQWIDEMDGADDLPEKLRKERADLLAFIAELHS